MARGKPLTVKPKPAGKFTQQQPKPCPTCYAPMRMREPGVYACSRHGAPDRP